MSELLKGSPYPDIPVRDGFENHKARILHLEDPSNRQEVAEFVKDGGLYGLQNYLVYAIGGDGENAEAFDLLCQVKGEDRRGRQVALTLPSPRMLEIAEISGIPDILQPIFRDAELMTELTHGMYFWRFPLKKEFSDRWASFPWLYSSFQDLPYVQVWDSRNAGHVGSFTDDMISTGVRFPFISSMNVSKFPEIIDYAKAAYFANARGLDYLLKAPVGNPVRAVGSYTTLTVIPPGTLKNESGQDYHLLVARDGNTPAHLIITILQNTLNKRAKELGTEPSELRVLTSPGNLRFTSEIVHEPQTGVKGVVPFAISGVDEGLSRVIPHQFPFPPNLLEGLENAPPALAFEVINAWAQDADVDSIESIKKRSS